jgi:hypothetical protein
MKPEYFFWLIPAAIVVVPVLALSLPPAVRERSWATFGLAVIQSAGGIVVPLLAFVASAFFTPEWKGGCRLGAVDCFHAGKVALAPLVLWAMASFYAATILKTTRPHHIWIKLGLIHGAVVSAVCLIHGFAVIKFEPPMLLGMLIPLYTAAWYGVTAYWVVLRDEPRLNPAQELTCFLSGAPWWLLAAFLSELSYRRLPTSPPSCFVVTAASHGHASLVGPFVQIQRGGRRRPANRQLLVFWAFEDAWRRRSPDSHGSFRRRYDTWGPRLARRIRSPFAADAVHLLLKPAEWAAAAILILNSMKGEQP